MNKELKENAKATLKGNWNMMALCMLVMLVIGSAIVALSRYLYGINVIMIFLVLMPMQFGIMSLILNLIDKAQKPNIGSVFSVAFSQDYGRIVAMGAWRYLFIFLWSLLLVIPGIIKAIAYSFADFVLAENKQLTARQALKKSEEILFGHKWEMFCLMFSFFFWWIACALTLGILALWVSPYMYTTMGQFYKKLTSETKIYVDSDIFNNPDESAKHDYSI